MRDNYKPPFGSANVPDEAYTDGAITSRANLILQDLSQNQTAPFFLAVGLIRPHLPFGAPAKYLELYKDTKLPVRDIIHKCAGQNHVIGQITARLIG